MHLYKYKIYLLRSQFFSRFNIIKNGTLKRTSTDAADVARFVGCTCPEESIPEIDDNNSSFQLDTCKPAICMKYDWNKIRIFRIWNYYVPVLCWLFEFRMWICLIGKGFRVAILTFDFMGNIMKWKIVELWLLET